MQKFILSKSNNLKCNYSWIFHVQGLSKVLILIILYCFPFIGIIAQDSNFQTKIPIQTLESAPVKLIPFPREVTWNNKTPSIKSIEIEANDVLSQNNFEELEQILKFNQIKIDRSSAFVLRFVKDPLIPKEGYRLKIFDSSIIIESSDDAGQFYALQTLSQLILKIDKSIVIQGCTIFDYPAFSVRGLMLDVGRNFFSPDLIREQLDIMAKYKMNTFHWHLTDRPAWRIESKKFPELNASENHRATRDPGKYYTYNEIRDLIKYAHSRQITVIPEIDMPGHSDSFVKATGVKMESEQGMQILEEILNEFFNELPFELCPYIHIGSDEVRIPNPDEFINNMVEICRDNGREVIIWNPGLPADQNVIRQTWISKDISNEGFKEIDSWNNYVNNGDPFVHISKLFFKPIGQGSKNVILGGILCVWHDVNLDDESDYFLLNPVYPSLLTYAWTTWTNDVISENASYLTKIPSNGTPENKYFEIFESYLSNHKELYFKNKPFQYFPQANSEWKLIGPYFNSDGLETVQDIRKKFESADSFLIAAGNSIYIRDRFKLGGYYPNAIPGETYFARTYIYLEDDVQIPTWIGFETAYRANRIYGGIPETGSWDVHGGNIWLNGNAIQPPNWNNPGWKPSKTSGWGSPEDQEIPWWKEEFYWTRNPVIINFKKGWNEIMVRIPGTSDYQNWMFTFAPWETNKLIFSAEQIR